MPCLDGRCVAALLMMVIVLAGADPAHAVVRSWNNPAGGAWGDAGNWLPVGVPAPADQVIISLPGTYTVTLAAESQVTRLTLGNVQPDVPTQELRIVNGALTVTDATNSQIRAQGVLRLMDSDLTLQGGSLQNFGDIHAGSTVCTITGSITNESGGLIRVASQVGAVSGGVQLSITGVFSNLGSIELGYSGGPTNFAMLRFPSGLSNQGAIDVQNAGPQATLERHIDGAITNSGQIDFNADCTLGGAVLLPSHVNQDGGEININGGAEVTVLDASSFSNAGSLLIQPDGVMYLTSSLGKTVFDNTGSIVLNDGVLLIEEGETTSSGTIQLNSPVLLANSKLNCVGGTLDVTGSISFGAAAGNTFVGIQLSGCTAGFQNNLVIPANVFGTNFNGSVVNGPGAVTAHGVIQVRGSTINAPLDIGPTGSVSVQPDTDTRTTVSAINGGFANLGELSVLAGDGMDCTLVLADGFDNHGEINMNGVAADLAEILIPGAFGGVINNHGLIHVQGVPGCVRTIEARIDNQGQIVSDTNCTIASPFAGPPSTNSVGGVINVKTGVLTFLTPDDGPVTFNNHGQINVDVGTTFRHITPCCSPLSQILNHPTGLIDGAGTIACAVSLVNSGVIGPLDSPIFFDGPILVQSSGGMVDITLGAVDVSVLQANSDMTLDGKLAVSLAPGYNPPAGTSVPILTYGGALAGTFDVAVLPGFPDERYMLVNYDGLQGVGGGSVTVEVNQLQSIAEFGDGQTIELPGDTGPTAGVLGDFDADTDVDLAITIPASGSASPGSVLVLFNAGSVDGAWQGFSSTRQFVVGIDPRSITTGLFDDDQHLDLAVANRIDGIASGTVSVLVNDGTGTFAVLPAIGVDVDPVAIASGDFGGGALAGAAAADDIVVAHRSSQTARVLANQGVDESGDPEFAVGPPVPTTDEPVTVDPADVDNDRDLDLIMAEVDATALTGGGSGNVVAVYLNDGTGGFGTPVLYPIGNNPTDVAVGLLNNDLLVDVVATNRDDDTISVLVNSGATPGVFGSAMNVATADQPRSLALAGIDLDGDLDLAVLAQDDDAQPIVQVLRNDSSGGTVALTPSDTPVVDAGAILVLAGDIDGLGNGDDLLTINDDTGDGAIASGGPATTTLTVLLNAAAPPCPADVFGEGDGVVNISDLLAIISSWGPCQSPLNCLKDINDDGTVNVFDLLIVISQWGPCPE